MSQEAEVEKELERLRAKEAEWEEERKLLVAAAQRQSDAAVGAGDGGAQAREEAGALQQERVDSPAMADGEVQAVVAEAAEAVAEQGAAEEETEQGEEPEAGQEEGNGGGAGQGGGAQRQRKPRAVKKEVPISALGVPEVCAKLRGAGEPGDAGSASASHARASALCFERMAALCGEDWRNRTLLLQYEALTLTAKSMGRYTASQASYYLLLAPTLHFSSPPPPLAMRRFSEDAAVQATGLAALAQVAHTPGAQDECMSAGCIEAAVRALGMLTTPGLKAMRVMTNNNEKATRQALEAGARYEWMPHPVEEAGKGEAKPSRQRRRTR